jgi:hypothetical protein
MLAPCTRAKQITMQPRAPVKAVVFFAPDASDAVEVRDNLAQHRVELAAPLEQENPSASQTEECPDKTEAGTQLAENRCHGSTLGRKADMARDPTSNRADDGQ